LILPGFSLIRCADMMDALPCPSGCAIHDAVVDLVGRIRFSQQPPAHARLCLYRLFHVMHTMLRRPGMQCRLHGRRHQGTRYQGSYKLKNDIYAWQNFAFWKAKFSKKTYSLLYSNPSLLLDDDIVVGGLVGWWVG
jgi:hypothetical protein